MKKLILLFFFLFLAKGLFSQNPKVTGFNLTKEQMYKDFDSFRETLREFWPHAEAQRLVTGIDTDGELDAMRAEIDTVTGDAGFFDVMIRTIFLCSDQHLSLAPSEWCPEESKISNEWINKYYRYGYNQKFPVKYIDGRYYTYLMTRTGTEETIVPEGARLLKISGIPIDSYVADYNRKMQSNTLWDQKHGKFYAEDLNDPRTGRVADHYTWTYEVKGKQHTVAMDRAHIVIRGPRKGLKFCGVRYFEDDGVLFVRLPRMHQADLDTIRGQLVSYKNKAIDRVIIDVRGNGGGSDRVWMQILAAILDKDLRLHLAVATKNADRASLINREIPPRAIQVGRDTLYEVPIEWNIKKADNSLDYAGTVYVIFDNSRCYSSTGSLKSACNRSDRLVSVGYPSGFLLGIGVTPMPGYLDESKLTYRIPLCLETTGVRSGHPEDYWQSAVEVEVKRPSFEKYEKIVFNTQEDIYSGPFLKKYDACYRRILKLR